MQADSQACARHEPLLNWVCRQGSWLTTHWPMPSPPPDQRSAPPSQFHPVYILGTPFHSTAYAFGQFGLAVLAMPASPSFSCMWILAEHGKLKSSWLGVSTTELKHQCVIYIILLVTPKHSTVPATGKKINSILAETSTLGRLSSLSLLLSARGLYWWRLSHSLAVWTT